MKTIRGRAARRRSGGSAIGELRPDLFRALCDPSRLWILRRLCDSPNPLTVSQIADCCPVDLSVVSRHLGRLRDAGIVASERRGKAVYYSVQASDLAGTLRRMADAIVSSPCCRPERDEA